MFQAMIKFEESISLQISEIIYPQEQLRSDFHQQSFYSFRILPFFFNILCYTFYDIIIHNYDISTKVHALLVHQPLPQHLHQLQPPFVFTFPNLTIFPQSGPVPRADYLLQPGSLEICPYGPLYTLSNLIPIE